MVKVGIDVSIRC